MESEKRYEEQALLGRRHSVSGSSDVGRCSSDELDGLVEDAYLAYSSSSKARSRWPPLPRLRRYLNSKVTKAAHEYYRPRRRQPLLSRFLLLLSHIPYIILLLLLVCSAFFPSYSNPPQRYRDLRIRVEHSTNYGAANPNNEKIFIAASLYDKDGGLVSGAWGRHVLELIDMLGHENVFLSLYENDPDEQCKEALTAFQQRVPCDSSIVYEHLDPSQLPHVTMLDGSQRLKRIAYLAEVRNRALRPLDDVRSLAHHTQWDKLLYLNDIVFDPVDAAHLLFNTNVDNSTGKTNYRAACAVDFINPFKFYDTFATRDLEGFSMGVPFYPWFTRSGRGESRLDVLSQTDAVRVRSCWGGMVAFEAKWFQPHLYEVEGDDLILPAASSNPQISDLPSLPPLRFRFEPDTYWDASECCLIHADLAHRPVPSAVGPSSGRYYAGPGIYMNPYVRVAYSKAVMSWLPFTKRFERLYTPVHSLVNWIGRRPAYNARRLEQPGDEVTDRVWQWDDKSLAIMRNGTVADLKDGLHGSFREVKRKAQPGQFCGSRKLLYIKQHDQDGDGLWGSAKVPRDR